jgi:hypothetical protein
VPGYLSAVSAVEADRLGERGSSRRVVVASIPFVIGFTAVFVLLGVGAQLLCWQQERQAASQSPPSPNAARNTSILTPRADPNRSLPPSQRPAQPALAMPDLAPTFRQQNPISTFR